MTFRLKYKKLRLAFLLPTRLTFKIVRSCTHGKDDDDLGESGEKDEERRKEKELSKIISKELAAAKKTFGKLKILEILSADGVVITLTL